MRGSKPPSAEAKAMAYSYDACDTESRRAQTQQRRDAWLYYRAG